MNHIIIAGLGNPGLNYEGTRHNIGFEIIDRIVQSYDFPNFSSKFSSLITSKILGGNKITLIKPQTFMNLSGEALSKTLHFYKIELDDLIVIHDDLDLPLAKVKMKVGGGSGGHNGIKSIDQHLGTDYYRLRIGIGKPQHKGEVTSFVLNKFTKEEEKVIEETVDMLLDHFELVIAKNLPMLMNNIAQNNKPTN